MWIMWFNSVFNIILLFLNNVIQKKSFPKYIHIILFRSTFVHEYVSNPDLRTGAYKVTQLD